VPLGFSRILLTALQRTFPQRIREIVAAGQGGPRIQPDGSATRKSMRPTAADW
jgi:hypothetical protein